MLKTFGFCVEPRAESRELTAFRDFSFPSVYLATLAALVLSRSMPLLSTLALSTLALIQQGTPAPQDSAARAVRAVSIASALAGHQPTADTVTISGRATASHGQLQRSALEISIDDGTGAIRVFSRSLDVPVRAGDSVVATGSVRGYRGSLELFATAVRIVPGARRTVAPIPLSLAAPVSRALEGRLVTVQGTVTGYGRAEGGEWLRLRGTRASDAGNITVWVHANHGGGVRLSPVRDADSVRVTGIVVAFQDNPEDRVVWQVVPRTPLDVVRLDRRRWMSGALWVLAGGLGLLALLAIILRLGTTRDARALRETEDRYRQLLDLSPDAVIVHENGRILFANPAAARMLAVGDQQSLVTRNLRDFADEDARMLVSPPRTSSGNVADPVRRVRGRVRAADGHAVEVEVTSSPCRYHDREATVLLARDISQQLRIERDLRSLALLDELTGLHNRRGFMLFAEQELTEARREGVDATLVFADLDGLKAINDQHGHAAGDDALRAMSAALRRVARESDVVARWAGDEFVALLVDRSVDDVSEFTQRLQTALDEDSRDLPFAVRASVGTSALDEGLAEALRRADASLYRAKGRR